jgi:hypothetical protein
MTSALNTIVSTREPSPNIKHHLQQHQQWITQIVIISLRKFCRYYDKNHVHKECLLHCIFGAITNNHHMIATTHAWMINATKPVMNV